MHVTREGDYAIRVIADLAARPPGTIVRSAELVQRTGVPGAYLRKIVQALVRARLVATRQGPRGGVVLRRDPATITLRQMIEAVGRPISLNRCLLRPGECPRDASCPAHPVWRRIQAALVRELDGVTARDLVTAVRAADDAPREESA